tara:strand:- start:10154 stop:10693 length:540 start_codon:yes stop_codon:yes gene_type:complete
MSFNKLSTDIIIHLTQYLNYDDAFSNGLTSISRNINNLLRETPKTLKRKIKFHEKIIHSILYQASRTTESRFGNEKVVVPKINNYNYFKINPWTYPRLDPYYNDIMMNSIQKNREHKKHLDIITNYITNTDNKELVLPVSSNNVKIDWQEWRRTQKCPWPERRGNIGEFYRLVSNTNHK